MERLIMNSSWKVSTLVVMSVVALGCVAFASGSHRAGRDQDQSLAVDRVVPRLENTLPYNGNGAVTILDDGTLLIEVGGEELPTPAPAGGSDEVEVRFTPFDVLAYQVNISGLVLVKHNGEVFLDKRGVETSRRGLSPRQTFRTLFPDGDEIDPDASRYAVVSFSGEMELSFDPTEGALTLLVADSDETGRVFRLTAPLVAGGSTVRAESDSAKGAATPTPEDDYGDSIVLSTLREGSSEWLRRGGSSSCSITCTRGGATIDCTESGCKCYCKAGKPVCTCVNSWVVDIE